MTPAAVAAAAADPISSPDGDALGAGPAGADSEATGLGPVATGEISGCWLGVEALVIAETGEGGTSAWLPNGLTGSRKGSRVLTLDCGVCICGV
jgi:hypothetical protein